MEIRGKIDSKMLSPNSTYAAYIVFKVAPGAYGLDSPYPETSVSLGGSKSACHVCFDVSDRDAEGSWLTLRPSSRRSYLEIPPPNVGAFSSQKSLRSIRYIEFLDTCMEH